MALCTRVKQQCISTGECHSVLEGARRALTIHLTVLADAGSANKMCVMMKYTHMAVILPPLQIPISSCRDVRNMKAISASAFISFHFSC